MLPLVHQVFRLQINSALPSSFKFLSTVSSPPSPQLSLLQSRVLHHHIPLGFPGHATNTTAANYTPCCKHIISYSFFSFLSNTLPETSQLHAAMLLAIPFPLGNSALLCCLSSLFTPGFSNLIKGLAGQTEFSLNFPVREKAPAFVVTCQGAAPTSDNAPGFVSYTTTTYLKLMP